MFYRCLWQWSRHVPSVIVTVKPSCFTSDSDSEPALFHLWFWQWTCCDSEAVMFHLWLWQWSHHASPLTVTVNPSCFTSDCDSEPVMFHPWLWQWNRHVLLLPVKMNQSCLTAVTVNHKLQALVHDILPSTTAVFSYAIRSRKLSANEQFFVGAQTVISLLQTTQK